MAVNSTKRIFIDLCTIPLVRVFGELKDLKKSETVQDEMAEMTRELKMLRQEVAELRSVVLSIEHQSKPASVSSALRKRAANYLLSFDKE